MHCKSKENINERVIQNSIPRYFSKSTNSKILPDKFKNPAVIAVLPGPGQAFLPVGAESSANFQKVRPFFEKVLFCLYRTVF